KVDDYKKEFTLLIILISALSFGQKIKLKKDILYADDRPVVNIVKIDKENNIYSISEVTSNDEIFKVHIKIRSFVNELGQNDSDMWLEIYKEGQNSIREIDYETITFSFNDGRVIGELLMKKYELFDASGSKKENIDAFLNANVERPGR